MNRWHHNNDVVIKKISMHVQNEIPYKAYILDFKYLEN